jgi:hypothetical protein
MFFLIRSTLKQPRERYRKEAAVLQRDGMDGKNLSSNVPFGPGTLA